MPFLRITPPIRHLTSVVIFLGTLFALSSLLPAAPKPDSARPAPSPTPSSDSSGDTTMSSRLIQREIMDFSDRYVAAIGNTIDAYIAAEPDPAKRVAAQAWKIRFGSASMSIAASSDPRSGLLDMTTFISVGKWSVRRYWVPEVFGSSASSLNEVYTRMDREIWQITATVLTSQQQNALRDLISAWEESNPRMHEVADVRLRNLDGVQLRDFDPANTARGILASLRNLLSKVDTSLLYGERVMFYMERTPRILEQQTTLTLTQIAEVFPITTIQPDLQRLNLLVDELPAQLQSGIDHNHALIKELLPEVRTTVESGERLAKSLDTTTQALRDLSEKIDPSADYASYLQQTSTALDNLNSSISGLNHLLAKDPATGESRVTELTTLIDQRSSALADKLFHRALILLAAIFVGLLVLLVVIRLLFPRRLQS
jgi:hypothetical protein